MAARRSTMRNMTEGNVVRHLIFFALPLVAGGLLQQFYNMVDSLVVGNFVGDSALAAVGFGWPISNMFIALFMGMGTGATVTISQFYGAGQMDRVRDVIDTLYTILVVAIIPITAAAMLLVEPLLVLLKTDPSCFADSRTYLLIICAGLIGTVGYNFNAGILQGLGDSNTSLLFLAVAAAVNIVLDLLSVVVFRMGVEGVALATIFAQLISWLFGIRYINRKYPEIAIRPFSRRFDKRLFKHLMNIGLPAGVQMALISVGVMSLMAKINSFGEAYTAGFNAGNKIDNLAWMPMQSLATACTALVGQNVGAGRYDRARKGIRAAILLGTAWAVSMTLLIVPNSRFLLGLFTQTPETIATGANYLICMMPFYPLVVIMFTLNNGMRGAGESVFPMICTIVSLIGVRVPSLYYLADHFGPDKMYFCYAIGWVVGAALAGGYYLSGRWKRHGSLADG